MNKRYVAPYLEDDAVEALADNFELAMDLIGRSVCEKTGAHMRSIEALLGQAAFARHSAQRFLDEAWPHIRARLLSYPASHDSRA